MNEIIAMMEQILGHAIERIYRPGRAFDVPISVLANTLAREELGWRPEIDLGAGMTKTAAWLRERIGEKR